MTTTVLETVEISKTYQMGDVSAQVLRDVNLKIPEGEIVVVLGPSGSGKSTLLNIIGGLDRATTGQFLYRGRDLTATNDDVLTAYRREKVGFIFQFYNLIPSLTTRENISLVAEIAQRPLLVNDVLNMVGLGDRMDHFPAQLSGGQQQRVAIARALVKRPDLLLCDEPTGALDIRTGITVLEVLERVNRELGTTALLITHNAGIAAMADRVITFKDGTIADVCINKSRVSPREIQW